MITENSYWLLKNVLPSKDRKNIKRIASEIGYYDADTRTVIPEKSAPKDTNLRSTDVAFSDQQYFYDLLCPFVNGANESAGWHFDLDWFSPVQIAKYKKNQHYDWHIDGASDKNGSYKKAGVFQNKVRKLSLVAILSNGYLGGEFELSINYKGTKNEVLNPELGIGDVIVFPSFVWHRSALITKGTKYSASMWCLGPPFK